MAEQIRNAEEILPVIEEELVATKRVVKTGAVRVEKHVDRRLAKVSMPVTRESVEVHRVPVNREVKTVPEIRTVGDTTIIPVVEEELVVSKRLMLKEEIHLTKRRTKEEGHQEIVIGKERAELMRMDAEGRVIKTSSQRPAKVPADR